MALQDAARGLKPAWGQRSGGRRGLLGAGPTHGLSRAFSGNTSGRGGVAATFQLAHAHTRTRTCTCTRGTHRPPRSRRLCQRGGLRAKNSGRSSPGRGWPRFSTENTGARAGSQGRWSSRLGRSSHPNPTPSSLLVLGVLHLRAACRTPSAAFGGPRTTGLHVVCFPESLGSVTGATPALPQALVVPSLSSGRFTLLF